MKKSILLASGSTLAIVAASTIAVPAFACSSSSACLSGTSTNGVKAVNINTGGEQYTSDASGIKYTSDQSWVAFPVSGSVHLTTGQGSVSIDPNHVCIVGPKGSVDITPGNTTVQSPAGTDCAAGTTNTSNGGTISSNSGNTSTNNDTNNTSTSAPQSDNGKITTTSAVTPAVSVSDKGQTTDPVQTTASVLPETGAGNFIVPAAVASVLAYAGNMLRLKRRAAHQS